jgi:hypothetical protein
VLLGRWGGPLSRCLAAVAPLCHAPVSVHRAKELCCNADLSELHGLSLKLRALQLQLHMLNSASASHNCEWPPNVLHGCGRLSTRATWLWAIVLLCRLWPAAVLAQTCSGLLACVRAELARCVLVLWAVTAPPHELVATCCSHQWLLAPVLAARP